LLAWQHRSAAARKEAKSLVHTLGDLLYAHGFNPRRRQLDCQWDAIQLMTDLNQRLGVVMRHREAGPG
jgi:hypothetical protein